MLPSQSYALADALTKANVRHRLLTFDGIAHGFRFALGNDNLIPDVLGFLDGALNGGSLDRRVNPSVPNPPPAPAPSSTV